ncbi:MAG: hypothetical protein QM831_15770 [Kofleriaceae bacterium]
MRFCPFCSAENADELAVCQACGRRLPPLPPRRGPTRNAPPTGIQLPNRPAGSQSPVPPPRARPGSTIPPSGANDVSTTTQAGLPASGAQQVPTGSQPGLPASGAQQAPTGSQAGQPPSGAQQPPTGSPSARANDASSARVPSSAAQVPTGTQPGLAPAPKFGQALPSTAPAPMVPMAQVDTLSDDSPATTVQRDWNESEGAESTTVQPPLDVSDTAPNDASSSRRASNDASGARKANPNDSSGMRLAPLMPSPPNLDGPTHGSPTYQPSGVSGPVSGQPSLREPPARDSAPALPPPPVTPPPTNDDSARRQLANALNPSPAAQRREAPAEERIIADRRGRNDSKQPLSPTSLTRPHSGSQPPPINDASQARVNPSTNPNASQTRQPFGAGVNPSTNPNASQMRPHSGSQPPPIADRSQIQTSPGQGALSPNDASQARQPFGAGVNPTTNPGASQNDQTAALGVANRPSRSTQQPFGAGVNPTTNPGAQQPFGAGVNPTTNSGIAPNADPDATHLARPRPASSAPGFGQPAAPAFGQPATPPNPNSTSIGRPHPPSQPPPFPGSGPNRAPTSPPPIPKSAPQASPFASDTFVTDNDYSGQIDALRDEHDPPPTRIHAGALVDRPFSPPEVLPIPLIPEPSLYKSARYAYMFARARWQRRGAIKQLQIEIRQDTDALDQVLGALGHAARTARVEGRVFTAENSAISEAQERINTLHKEEADVEGRKTEENSKYGDIERERNTKLSDAERMVGEAQSELSNLEAQRRSLRDKRKEIERRLKTYLGEADKADRLAGSAPLGDQRQEQRRIAEGHRKEAAALDPDRKEIDQRLGAIERPINEVAARLDAGKAELDAAKRSLNDAREGHTHRLAELDAEQKRKAREISLAESEIERRLVTLGTLVNLNRIEDPTFTELYTRIDRLRGAITARTTEIEKLTAEREAYDRHTLVRGVATIGGAILVLIALIVIVAALL